jgi:hypothetical protein
MVKYLRISSYIRVPYLIWLQHKKTIKENDQSQKKTYKNAMEQKSAMLKRRGKGMD